MAVRNLGGIEFTGNRCSLAQSGVVDCRFGTSVCPITLTRASGCVLRPSEPPQTESKHDGRRDDAEPRGSEGRCRRTSDGILQGRGAGGADIVKVMVPVPRASGVVVCRRS